MKLKILLVTTLLIIIISINMFAFIFSQEIRIPNSNFKQESASFINEGHDNLLSDRKHYTASIPLQNWPNYSVAVQTTEDHLDKDEANKNNN